jgi:SNF2-related domain
VWTRSHTNLEAVYDYLLKLARVRFLLADDAGAGKTIMAGLLIRELKLRGLAERILIVCPANLTFQWRRELWDKFRESFDVQSGDALRDQYGLNQWIEKKQVVTSLDLAKRENILPGLKQVRWDLVIVDTASSGNLPLASGSRERTNVHFVVSGFIGLIGEPVAIRRKSLFSRFDLLGTNSLNQNAMTLCLVPVLRGSQTPDVFIRFESEIRDQRITGNCRLLPLLNVFL